jgi:hypothetical protein
VAVLIFWNSERFLTEAIETALGQLDDSWVVPAGRIERRRRLDRDRFCRGRADR